MSPLGEIRRSLHRAAVTFVVVLAALVAGAIGAEADEAGVSFWVPGTFGALAAAPLPQGFTLAEVYYHSPVKAGADVATAIQISRAGVITKLPATLDFHLGVQADLMLSIPSYVFATPVLGGQLQVGLLIPYGRNKVAVDQTLIGPMGGSPPSAGGPLIDSVSGLGDLEPQTSLRWNFGVNNFMVYMTGDVPVGLYSPIQLANIGYGHGAIDGGAGYTYFNEKTGYEFSTVLGFTYNFINPGTQYQNGVDVHLDWSASKFLTKQVELGAAGYFYNQASCDTGTGAVLGCFETRVLGVGPQLGYVIPLGDLQGYVNVKAYQDFDWAHRAHGWSGWLTFVISNSPTDAQHTPPHR
jgi:hypothetical protein